LGEIEAVLERHPAVLQAAVVPLASDDKAPDSLRACVVLKNTSLVSPQTLNRHCAQYLPPYMVPTTVEIRAQLPTTANGKLDRLSLGREFAIASGT
jgi:acyl-coenzyme A synthetase/AMP-(fatty) acid ligase